MIRKMLLTGMTTAAMAAAFMPSANAGVTNCTFAYVGHGVEAQLINCTLDDAGTCTFYFDPLKAPFPSYLVSETIEYPLCVAI